MSREPPTDPTRSQPPAGFAALESIEAPPALRSAVQQLADEASAGRRPAAVHRSRWDALRRLRPGESPRLRWAGVGALAAMATAAVVLAAVLLSGSTQRAGTPTVLQTSRVALAAATLPAPGEDPRRPSRLALAVDGVSFPYWGGRTGWETAGARVDSLAGRRVTTVFYAGAHGGARIGYAIVAGPALPVPAGGRTVWRGGVRFTVLSAIAGATVVTWREGGHTCVLAARAVPAHTLVGLVS